MTKFKLDPSIAAYMERNGCDEIEAANELQLNIQDIYDVVEDGGNYDFED